MLRRARRLHTARDYREMWRSGRAQRGRYVVVRLRPAAAKESRFGFVVSTAVAKRATDRNLIKRRLRAAARALGSTTNDVVVYATKATLAAPYAALAADLRHVLTSKPHAPSPHRHN